MDAVTKVANLDMRALSAAACCFPNQPEKKQLNWPPTGALKKAGHDS
jgi:hypothetical protein